MTDLLEHVPYARFLCLRTERTDGELIVTMPFADRLVGNPMLPALHGGTTAALLEMTAIAQMEVLFPRERPPRPINVTVAYLRTGRPRDVHAHARISKAGRRIAHVLAEAWQDDRNSPIASMTAHFLLDHTA